MLRIGSYDGTAYEPRQVWKEAAVSRKGLVISKPGLSSSSCCSWKCWQRELHDRIWE